MINKISELIEQDADYYCFINPFLNNNSDKSKAQIIASFIEKKKKINIESIKLKNKQLKKTLNSPTEIINNNTKENIKKRKLSPKSRINGKALSKFSPKMIKLPKFIPFRLKKSKSNYKINFFNDYENNFFFDSDYSFLEYNATEIFNNKSKYKKIILDKINDLKKGIFDKKTIKLEKRFYFGRNKKEINLRLNTLIISLEDMTLPPEMKNDKLNLNLPISLLPLFYYNGLGTFQKLISVIIKVENNFEKIYFNEKALEIALNNISDFKINEDKNLNNYNTENIKYDIIKSPILQRNTNFLNFNYFTFYWSTNSKNYLAKITLPCINLDIIDNKTTLKIFIDYELLFYLFEKNFEHWEFYIIKYLSTFSKYRNIFQQLDANDEYNNKTIFLKETKSKINNFSEDILFNLYTDKNNDNQIVTFKSFYIIVNLVDEKNALEKNYLILFNFFQFVKLFEIAKYSNKIDFIIKFLEIDSENHKLSFNFKKYDEFDAKSWMKNIKKFSDNSINNKKEFEEELNSEFKVYTKKVKIEFKKPLWSILKLQNSKEITKTWEIGNETEILLIESITNPGNGTWLKFLNECLKKIDEPYEEFPTYSRTSIKRRPTKKMK